MIDIESGHLFEIMGCKDCNIPYYNERPESTIYNYSIPLKTEEINLAKTKINLKLICQNNPN